ncbi:MAG: diguanylate cyclase [Desulfobacteraceae bacterium]|nr:MAG: diguanylate cyclase [Desulfobacteraceae bacterium]
MTSQNDAKILELEERIATLQSQKDRLIKELDEIEERYEKSDRLYKKYIPLIIDPLVTEDSGFGKACGALATALKKGDSSGKVEFIFEQIKNALLKEDIGPGAAKKKKGLFAAFKKDSSATLIDDLRQGYHEAVNILKASLGEEYIKKLDRITLVINSAEDTSDFARIRDEIFSLIQGYINLTNADREKVASFVQEVVSKIFEIESILLQSYDYSDQMTASNQGFEAVLSSELQTLKDNTRVTTSLEELKEQISKRLETIEKALQEKQAFDHQLKAQENQSKEDFQTDFKELKKELDRATRHSEELEKKLNQDQLTGAFNRRAYDRKIEDEMERFLRYKSVFSLLLIDADKFKNINDTYGHSIGDKCLKEIIKRAMPLLRKNDMLARYGGEEFVVIMPETDQDGAREAAEKIRQTIEKIGFVYKKERVKVTVSIGVAQTREGDTTHEAIFERADIAVYQAKEKGRNQVVVYTS